MKYFIYRFNPSTIGIKADSNLSVICPERLKDNYLELNFPSTNISTIKDFDLPELLQLFESRNDISDIFTLDEGLMHITGILKSLFTDHNQAWKIAYAYKDKKIMRQTLAGKINQPALLDNDDQLPDQFMIKPRCEASGKDIHIVSEVPDYYSTKDYILETVESFDTMFTCDGIAVNGKIEYFFTHEYIGNILDIKKNYFNIIRTNSFYNNEQFIERLKNETQCVLDNLGTEEVHPFHSEFFYQADTDRLSFCEIGKRFGGGNIPLLVKQAFKFDLLATYWKLINGNLEKNNYNEKPQFIALTLAIFQSGQKQLPPTLPITFDYYREYPEKESISATSLDDLRFLITFTLKSQQEFTHVFELLKGYLHEQRK